MNNPLTVSLTKNVWTKVATSVVTGNIAIIDDTVGYRYTYRKTGDYPPTTQEGVLLQSNILSISATEYIDVYMKSVRGNGIIEVMI